MKAVSSSNVIKHIASPEWNWNLLLSNVKNRGADSTKAKHQHITMLIKFVLFVNNTRYLPGFMTQKYRLTAIIIYYNAIISKKKQLQTCTLQNLGGRKIFYQKPNDRRRDLWLY